MRQRSSIIILLLLSFLSAWSEELIRVTGFEPGDRFYIPSSYPGNVRMEVVQSLTCPEGKCCLKVVMGDRENIPTRERHWGNVRIPLPVDKIPPEASGLRFWIKGDGSLSGLGVTLALRQQWNWLAQRGDRKSWLDFADGSWQQLECRLEDFVPYEAGKKPDTARNFQENTSILFQMAGWYGRNVGRTLIFYLDQIEIVLPTAPLPPPLLIALAGGSDCRQPDQNGQRQGWGEALKDFFSPSVSLCYFGQPGISSKWFLEKGFWDDLLAIRPDCIFLSLGNGDALPGDRHTDPNLAYRENLRRFAREARQAGAELYLISPLPLTALERQNGRREPSPELQALASCDEHRAAMRAIAKESNLPFIELPHESKLLLPPREQARNRAQAISAALRELQAPCAVYLQNENSKE